MDVLAIAVVLISLISAASAQIRPNYYSSTCPNVESIVRAAVEKKFKESFAAAPATIRLFFHDCAVEGCDASIMIASAPNRKSERDHPDNVSLSPDGYDTVLRAKAAVDATPGCKNVVSCADILVMATRESVRLTGGPTYDVELGRLDGLVSKPSSVNLPRPDYNLSQLVTEFGARGLSQTDMIALSAAHSIGSSHCNSFSNRLYNFSLKVATDPTLDAAYASKLKLACPMNANPSITVFQDPTTSKVLDNVYFKNLQNKLGLFRSDQILFGDLRSQATVNLFANNATAFNRAFVTAMTNLGRVGVKTSRTNGNIRFNCTIFN